MKTKYKHGRVGVKRPTKPLSLDDSSVHYERGWKEGERSALLKGLETANNSRTIKECRAALQELVNASA